MGNHRIVNRVVVGAYHDCVEVSIYTKNMLSTQRIVKWKGKEVKIGYHRRCRLTEPRRPSRRRQKSSATEHEFPPQCACAQAWCKEWFPAPSVILAPGAPLPLLQFRLAPCCMLRLVSGPRFEIYAPTYSLRGQPSLGSLLRLHSRSLLFFSNFLILHAGACSWLWLHMDCFPPRRS